MARVPDSFVPQVGQTGVNLPEMAAPAGRPMQNAAPEMLERQGRAMVGLGSEVFSIGLDIARQADQLRVDDALNQVKEASLKLTYDKDAGFVNLKGINALQRPGNESLTDEYGGNLDREIEKIAGTLSNADQRRAFAMGAGDILTAFRGKTTRHETQEYRTYTLSVAEGIQKTAMRDIALNYRDPGAVNSAVERINAQVWREAQTNGKSAEWQEAAARTITSKAHLTAMTAVLEDNDPAYAESYLEKYADQMEADDILRVKGLITKEMDIKVANGAADEIFDAVQSGGDFERAFDILLKTESGGRQFDDDGKLVVSPAGAVGIAQVMPGTGPEAAKLAGLPWDEKRYRTDGEYNKALGKAYFQAQLRAFGGDLEKAYAAYNAGPGRVKKGVKNNGDDWLKSMPEETQNYVAKNMRAFKAGSAGAGSGVVRLPSDLEIDNRLRSNPALRNNPERMKIAREEAKRRKNAIKDDVKQRGEEAVANAMNGMLANGGYYNKLPPAIRNAVPPDKVPGLIEFGDKIENGEDRTNLAVYNDLSSNRAYLASLTDAQFYALKNELSDEDWKHFAKERAKFRNPTEGNGPGDLNTGAITRATDQRLLSIGIDPNASSTKNRSVAARVGAIRRFIDQSLLDAQRESGKKFTEAEIVVHIDSLFSTSVILKGWFGRDETVSILELGIDDLDDVEIEKIKKSLNKSGIQNPTNDQILNTYRGKIALGNKRR